MGDKTDVEVFFSYMPSLKIWYKLIFLYFIQILIFILVMIFFWWISSQTFYGAILGQFTISFFLVIHFLFMANYAERIRNKYVKKYRNFAVQSFWFHFQSWTQPVISAAFYFPLLLKTDYFLPNIVNLPSHFITESLLPYYVAIPLGLLIVIFGLSFRKFSGGYGIEYDDYLYVIHPEKSMLITGGIYQYIRNPQYLSRGIIAVGFGVLANNIIAIIVGLIHFLSYVAIIPAEDRGLNRRFGDDFVNYCRRVPALFPRYGNWKRFFKYIFVGEKK